jgi:hypothetical protein
MGKNHTTQQLNESANKYLAKEKVYEAIEAQTRLSVNSYTAFIEADAFIGNPYSLLGRVLMIRKSDGKCPDGMTDKGFMTQIAPLPIPGIKIEEKSKIEQPIKRGSIIVTQDLSVKVGFLNYLSAEFSANTTFSIMVFDQLTGLVDVQDTSWENGLNQWLLNSQNQVLMQDPDVCYLYAIIGIVQKNVIRKKYSKLDAKAGGGAYGININGEIHTSNEDYSLDIRFGITPVIIKSPTYSLSYPKAEAVIKMSAIKELKKTTTSLIDFSLKNSKSLRYTLPNEGELSLFSRISKFK